MVCDEASKNKKVLPPSKNGGLTAIRVALSSDIQVLRDIAAGSSFREALVHKTDEKVQYSVCFAQLYSDNYHFVNCIKFAGLLSEERSNTYEPAR